MHNDFYIADGSFEGECCLLSVVVPVFNAEKSIARCIESVLDQGFEDMELILVDDGSTDRSGLICDGFASSMVRVVHKYNEGPLIARAEGFAMARGQYLMTIDADDVYLPGALKTLARVIQETNADVVLFGWVTSARAAQELQCSGECITYSMVEKREAVHSLCTGYQHNAMWRKAVKRSCACVGADYSDYQKMKYNEDFLQTLSIYEHADTFCEIKDALYYYRANPFGLVNSPYGLARYENNKAALLLAESYAEKWEQAYGMDDLLEGLAVKGLESTAKYVNSLAVENNRMGLSNLSRSVYFCNRYKMLSARRKLRLDKRLVLALFNWHKYSALRLVSSGLCTLQRLRAQNLLLESGYQDDS